MPVSNAPGGLDLRPTWAVGFMRATEAASWWQRRLLRRGYAHCWATRPLDLDGEGIWLWVEWVPDCVIFGLASTETVERAIGAAFEVVEWRQDLTAEGAPRRPILAWHQCVTLVAHTIGRRPRPLATPWWLRCALLRDGGRPMVRAHSSGAGSPA